MVDGCRPTLETAGFVTAKGEVKLMLTGSLNQKQIDDVVKNFGDLEADVKRRGLVGEGADEKE